MIAIHIASRSGKKEWLSPVILSYGVGIIIANLKVFPINQSIAHAISEVSILLAIPLLLFSTDLWGWFKFAKTTILSFGICVLSGLIITFLVSIQFKDSFENLPLLAGMITGIYTGGIPNMNAIGIALQSPEELIIYLNASDVIVGGVFLLFLTSFAPKVYALFLPKFSQTGNSLQNDKSPLPTSKIYNLYDILCSVGLAIIIIGISIGITWLITRKLESISLILLLLTTFSILASFSKKIRNWRGSYELGDYLLLVFCVAIGMLANFQNVISEGSDTTIFMACILIGTVSLHLFISWIFKIDRDTTMITSTAALYGPPFIGQIANVINNRTIVFSGMATGLVGYAIGNYLGIGMANLLELVIN